MSLGGSEYTLNIKLNVTNLKEVQEAIGNLGRGGGGGGGGGAPGGGSSSGGVGPGGMNEGGGGRRRSRSNAGLETFTAPNTTPLMPNDVTGGGSATGRISRKRNAQMLEVMVTGEHNLDMASAANRQFAFDSQAQFKAQTQSAYAQISNVMAGGDVHREANRAANRQFVHDSQARFKTETQSAYASMADVMAMGDVNRAKNAAANAQYGQDVRSNQSALASRLAADRNKKFQSSAMGKFLAPPQSMMGLYFSAVFGGWEVAQAGRNSAMASVAGLGAKSSVEYMSAQVQSATAGFGGPLAGMASLPLDLFGRGPTSLAVDAAGTAGVYNSQTALMQSRMLRGQAGRRAGIAGDTTTAAYGFASRNMAISSSLESAAFANRETTATASIMMAGGATMPTLLNDAISMAFGNTSYGKAVGSLGGFKDNPAFATGKNMAAQAKIDLETAKANAEHDRRMLRDDFAEYRRGLSSDESLRGISARRLNSGSPYNSVSDNEAADIAQLRGERGIKRSSIVRNSVMYGYNGMAFGGDATVRNFDAETGAMIGSITKTANYDRRALAIGNDASAQRTFGINRSTELALSGRPLAAQLAAINASRNSQTAMIPLMPVESRTAAYDEIRASADSQEQLAKFDFGSNRYNVRRGQLTTSRQLSAMEGRYGYAAGALGISGAAVQAANGLRIRGMGQEADATLGLASRAIGLERRNYLEAFRGEQFDVRNIGISSRDQENVGATLGGIDSAMKEVADATKQSADKIIQAIKDLVSN